MRIGIIGSAGTGKTTLAKALAKHLHATYVPDAVLAVLKDRGRESWQGVVAGDRRRIREEALRRKISAEASEEAFVSDKTVIDYLAYWLQNQSEQELRNVNEEFLSQCKEAAKRYDVLVLLPYREDVSYALGRNQDPVHNLKVAAHKLGLLILLDLPFVQAPYRFDEDLHAWCAKWLPAAQPEESSLPAKEVTE